MWIVSALVALLFVVTGIFKVAAVPAVAENFARWGFSPAFMTAIGAIEIGAGRGATVAELRRLADRLLDELEDAGCVASATGPLNGTAAGSIVSPLVQLVAVAVEVVIEVVATDGSDRAPTR